MAGFCMSTSLLWTLSLRLWTLYFSRNEVTFSAGLRSYVLLDPLILRHGRQAVAGGVSEPVQRVCVPGPREAAWVGIGLAILAARRSTLPVPAPRVAEG